MDALLSWLPFLPVLISVLIFAVLASRFFRRRRIVQRGEIATARVVSISQTGTMVNQVPQMQITVDIESAGETPRRVTFKQVVDIGSMPRAGDRVYVLFDPQHPDRVILSPSPSGLGVPVPGADGKTLDQDVVRDLIALSPQLRERGERGIATVVSVAPVPDSAQQIVLEVDGIGTPKRRVTITQIVDGPVPAAGDRVYILVDPEDPACVALVPGSWTQGQSLPRGANRLDPLVLGPELLRKGAKASGTVLSATRQPMGNPALEGKGFSKWSLGFDVRPEDGSPTYRAEMVISLTSPEKAQRIAQVGVEVPLRYDPADPQSFAIDSIAMGYGDPYEAALKAAQSMGAP